jgi:hypothetical protein
LLPDVVTQLHDGALTSAPGVVFNTAPYAYLDKQLFAAQVDEKTFKRLGVNLTCEAKFKG